MAEAVKIGAISDVLVAYSRKKGSPKTYVQDMVRESKVKVRRCAHIGASINTNIPFI